MKQVTKVELILDGLSCTSCAGKIEDLVKKIKGVKVVSVNFATQTIYIEVDGELVQNVIMKTKDIVKKIEPLVIVKEKDIQIIKVAIQVKKYNLENLGCANCAAKIESEIKQITGVENSNVNFATKSMKVEYSGTDVIEQLESEIKKMINKIESEVVVTEIPLEVTHKKVLILEGLSCSSCATKIEDKVKNMEGVDTAFIDFASSKFIIELSDRLSYRKIVENVTAIVSKIEPDVKVLEEKRKLGQEDEKKEKWYKRQSTKLMVSSILFFIALLTNMNQSIEISIFILSYILAGSVVIKKALRNIIRGQMFDENFLVFIATIGAFAINEAPEGVAVMLFFQVGEYLQAKAVNHSRKSISALMDIRPEFANLKLHNEILRVTPEEVLIGDEILVKPGERVPLDGVVIEGKSMVDTSALTGESVPRSVKISDDVLSGFINVSGVITVKVTKNFSESTVSKILDLVQNASSKKAPTENFITKFSKYYTPFVVFTAIALAVIPPFIIEGAIFSDWLYRALVFLVISCPCALVVSIPLGFFGGIGGASKRGVLIKGSNYLEALNNIDTVVFDKTGTLTQGVFKVTRLVSAGDMDKDDLLEYAAFAECFSNHPIALSILNEYGKVVDQSEVKDYEEISGHGIKVNVKKEIVLAGNKKLMDKENIDCPEVDDYGTVVHIAVNNKYSGYIIIADEVKTDSETAIRELKKMGVKNIVMLTGDNSVVADRIGSKLGLDKVYSELLPHQKVEKLEMLDDMITSKGKLVFVGDGINDAPVLARADVGIAMGGLGSDAAIEAADIVLMTDEPSKLVIGIKIARRTRRIVWQNIIFALGVKAIFLILGAVGVASLWEAVFADVGVTVIAVLNSMRVMNTKKI
ncbi:MAG: cadmium-translocating P-type ATPase [Dethiosulfatibacter sp.]|nr:cadmium-translocating P-type ATPase [Dethiosulfatibacter sp.]